LKGGRVKVKKKIAYLADGDLSKFCMEYELVIDVMVLGDDWVITNAANPKRVILYNLEGFVGKELEEVINKLAQNNIYPDLREKMKDLKGVAILIDKKYFSEFTAKKKKELLDCINKEVKQGISRRWGIAIL
jgi:hypothetical protein